MIVDSNLEALIKKHKIVDKDHCFDTTCISLSLDKKIKKYQVPDTEIITYEDEINDKYIKEIELTRRNGYVLQPNESILACSNEKIQMPESYFGLLQTKGSLARLFVFLNCADGQVDPGYKGKITFEIHNASNFKIKIKPGQSVGNLYIFKTSMTAKGYHGRYQNANAPTCSKSK